MHGSIAITKFMLGEQGSVQGKEVTIGTNQEINFVVQ
jgi:hypothetical protein